MNTMEVIGIILIIAGIILASVEMYIPGFGVPGISAAICLVSGVLLTAKNVMQGNYNCYRNFMYSSCYICDYVFSYIQGKSKIADSS